MSLRPLEGFLIGITADRRWQEQAELLSRRGAAVMHGPAIKTHYLASDDDLHRATDAVIAEQPGYVVATTGIGIRAWLEAAAVWGSGDALVAALGRSRIVARGPKAAATLQAADLAVWARPESEQMEDVARLLLAERLAGKVVAVQEYGVPVPEFAAALRAAGARVVEVPVYRWQLPDDTTPARRLVQAACEGRLDAVTFTSAPAVHNLFAVAAECGAEDQLRAAFRRGMVAACVGSVCASGASEQGIASPLFPSVGRLGLLIRELSDHFEGRRRRLRFGPSEVVVQGSAVEVDGRPTELTPKERALFEALSTPPGVVLSRPRLLEQVWGSADADPHVLEVTVARLRRRLGPCGAALQPWPGRGYWLDVDEERVPVGR